MGGSWAVTATDFLKTLILIPITILVGLRFLKEIGGIAGLFAAIDAKGLSTDYAMINRPDRFDLSAHTWMWAISMMFKQIIGYNTMTSAQRYFLVKD